MFYLKNLWSKVRYSHFLRLFFDTIAKFGIRISPYYLFEEVIAPDNASSDLPVEFEDYKVSFWGPEEIKAMTVIPGRKFSEEFLMQRLEDGHLCLGLKKNNKIAAFTWCNFKEISLKWNRIPLEKDEAYLFDAYTLMEYRGKGIAPFLRQHLYKELEKTDRTKLYSYSDYFNTSAVKFKQKLDAEIVKLFLVIEFFGKWHFSFLLKNYQK